jgi:hypothetical protein
VSHQARRRRSWPVACALAVLALACQSEVTLRLLSGVTSGPGDGAAEAPPVVCQPLGPEVCNGGDDDCNGVIDDGCAITVQWSAQSQSPILGHDTGGVDFQAPCPQGAVLAGLKVGMGDWLNMVAAACRPLSLVVDSHGTPTVAGLGSELDTSYAPANSTDMKNQMHSLLCPTGSMLSGFDGTTSTASARYIYGIQVRCAPPIVTTVDGANLVTPDVSREQAVGPVLCVGCAATQAFDFSTSVPSGQVATGVFGGDGLWVDRVGFDASRATITPR